MSLILTSNSCCGKVENFMGWAFLKNKLHDISYKKINFDLTI